MTLVLYRPMLPDNLQLVDGFTRKYDVNRLVYFEAHANPTTAIEREKRLKKWHRKWKLDLIEKSNPDWTDLSDKL